MDDPIDIEGALTAALDWWDTMGVDVDRPAPSAKPRVKPAVKTPAQATPAKSQPPAATERSTSMSDAAVRAAKIAASAKTRDDLKTAIAGFDAGVLSDSARQMVFSRGNPQAKIMVIGESPGRDEDLQGKPFVGRSGQLLDRMFASIGLTEDDIYITNVINWRPPKSRNPKVEEIDMCRPFIMRHIELMDPRYIVIVGGISLTALTGETGIMKLRGQWQDIKISDKTIPALPLYHPAFLLRQPALKRDAWRDLLALRAKLEDG